MKLKLQTLILILSLFVTFSCTVNKTEPGALPRSTPETEGFSSQAILDFINAVEASNNEMHSFMIVRHGKVIAEGWWNPYSPELKHTMYSTSKSFTSTAIGFAVSEGLLSVSDKLVSFFPEYLPDTISDYLADVEIRDLLSMSFGQQPEPPFPVVTASDNWIKTILSYPVVNEPGSVFLYNSFATYLCSAIVQKVSGEKVADYLKPRLFDPLGISGADWEADPMDINVGGWGLRIKTEDMAKLGLLYLQHGMWKGKPLLPAEWIEEATTMKILQSPEVSDEDRAKNDWLQGYGYQFWRSRHNSFRGDGAFGQYILVLPEKDAVIAITSETASMPDELNLVWEHLLPGFKEEKMPGNKEVYNRLAEKLENLRLAPPEISETSGLKELFNNKTFMFPDQSKIKSVSFQFENEQCNAAFIFADGLQDTFRFGANKWISSVTNKPVNSLTNSANSGIAKMAPFKITGAYSSPDKNSLDLILRYIESPHTDFYFCRVNGDSIKVETSNSRTQRKIVESFTGVISK